MSPYLLPCLDLSPALLLTTPSRCRINKEVLPLKANLIIQEARFNVAQGDLNAAQAQLDAKQKELDVVQAVYDAAMKKKQVSHLGYT